jgi:hypothetical protein
LSSSDFIEPSLNPSMIEVKHDSVSIQEEEGLIVGDEEEG